MKIHKLKLDIAYCDAVYSGEKPFEIRTNDRGYQKGDFVVFTPVDGIYTVDHPVQDNKYEITYVLSYFGLKDGYVAFGIREVEAPDD